MKNKLIVIQGPTASGKTALAIALAKKLKTVIFSADSRQFYDELSIGTAKPSQIEQDGIKHFFVGDRSIHQALTAAQYEKEAILLLEEEFKKHKEIILVGGSGMFIDALCYGLDEMPHDEKVKNKLIDEVENFGLEKLLLELEEKDPVFYQIVDKKNSVRVIRALEVIRISGKTYSSYRTKSEKERPFESIKFTIDLPRELLYERINQRVDEMVKAGLLEEVKSMYLYKELPSLRTVGYTEFFAYLDDKNDFDAAVNLVKQNTRNYAKRQLTWFRKDKNNCWLKGQTLENQKEEILSYLSNN